MIHLEPHGADVLVGTGPQYPWGGLYGGQIVAQALRAAAATVEPTFLPHSLRAYFIRAGDHLEPVRYEVDRIRNGRSFCTRRVVARQAIGAILNLEASFHVGESSPSVQTIHLEPGTPEPDGLVERFVDAGVRAPLRAGYRRQPGRARCWFRMRHPVGDDPLLHATALAYMSDDLPTDAVARAMRLERDAFDAGWFSVSLDHTVWFHRPLRADEWHLQDFTCHGFNDSRGLAIGHVFDAGRRPRGDHRPRGAPPPSAVVAVNGRGARRRHLREPHREHPQGEPPPGRRARGARPHGRGVPDDRGRLPGATRGRPRRDRGLDRRAVLRRPATGPGRSASGPAGPQAASGRCASSPTPSTRARPSTSSVAIVEGLGATVEGGMTIRRDKISAGVADLAARIDANVLTG